MQSGDAYLRHGRRDHQRHQRSRRRDRVLVGDRDQLDHHRGGCGTTPTTCAAACAVVWCCGKNGACSKFAALGQAKVDSDCNADCAALGDGFISFVDPSKCAQTITDILTVSPKLQMDCK